MTDRTTRQLSWGLWIAGLVVFLAAGIFRFVSREAFQANDLSELAFASIGVVGLIVALHQPRNAIGWIYLTVWLGAAAVFAGLQEYAYWVEVSHPGAPGGSVATWLGNWAWVPIFVLLLTYPFLLFPDGHLPSRRWRPVAWAIAIAGTLWSVTFALNNTGEYTDALNHPIRNPYAPAPPTPLLDGTRVVVSIVLLGLMAATIVSLVLRYRRAHRDQREQIRWLLLAGAVTLVWFVLPLNHGVGGWVDFIQALVLTLIPISVGIAILRYRLYDVDVVINRTVVFAVLAGFITVVYVAIVVGVGTLIGARGSPVLSGIAAAGVAIAFQPVRRWGQRVANRLVYGRRATPYEVLSEFSGRLASAYADDDLLPRMARILGEGTGAARADVWLKVGSSLRPAATYPMDAPRRASLHADEVPPEVRPVVHQGELLGGLSIEKRPGEPLTPTEDKLIDDLASQAGLVLRNVTLIEELKASRQRLVSAQDEERRKIERNLHDGAQQQLVALAVKLRLADGSVGRDDDRAHIILGQAQADANDALENLRDLARGIYPPLLSDKGLAAALDAQARKAALPVTVQADGVGRFPQRIEGTVYFCTLEALNNVAKYAEASRATVRLANGADVLWFEIEDDGRGFDPDAAGYGTGLQGIADRLAALGGSLDVRSSPGNGTTITGFAPGRGGDGMTHRTAAILAWGSCAISVLFVALSIVVTAGNAAVGPTPFGPDIALSVPATAGLGLVLLSFSVVGALIAVRRPDNGVGWLFCANGLADSFFNLAGSLEAHGLVTNPGTIPGAAWFGLASDALWLPFIAMTTMFLFLLFPEGRPVGTGRRVAVLAGVIAVAVATIGGVLEPHLYGLAVANPITFRLSSRASAAVIVPGYVVMLAVLLWSVWDLLRRLRRSTGEARLQLRWFVYAALLVLVVFIPSTLVPSAGFWWQVLGALALVALPVSVGIATSSTASTTSTW